MNRRRHPRIALAGMVADISDGKRFFTGTVHDISRFGMAVDGLPEKLDLHAHHFTLIVDGQGGHFRLKMRPRWVQVFGHERAVGGEIDGSSLDWTDFVRHFEPEDDDFWGNL